MIIFIKEPLLLNEEIKSEFKAKQVLDYLKCSEAERQEYEAFKDSLHDQASMYESTYVVGHMDGKKEGRMEGEQIGIEKGKIEMAKSMWEKGLAIKMIAEITGLNEEQILS
jgi:predicted transposase/invertase (TIGR01784 family)